jgi:hypothetical protein
MTDPIMADAVTGGFIGGTIAAVVLALCAVAALVVGLLIRRDGQGGDGGFIFGGLAVLVVVSVAWVWASWPLAYDYHHWVDKRVTVTEVSSRLLSDGDHGISQKFVVRDPSGVFYGIQDTRAALIHKGDTVHLRCKKAYQYGVSRASHGWDCRWAA